MKLFPLLLASTLAIPFAAPAHADCGGGNGSDDPPSNGCNGGGGGGGWTIKNNQDYSGNNRNNDYSGWDNSQTDKSTDNSGNNRGNDYSGWDNSQTDNRNQGNDYSDNRNQGNNYGNIGTNAGGGDITNTAEGGKGGKGGTAVGIGVGQGGDGGEATIERGAVRNNNTVTGGNQRNVVRGSGNSENTNTNRARGGDQSQSQSNRQSQSSSSTSSANNNGNHQNVLIEGDEREVPIAPLPTSDSVGQIGDIVVPLPNVGLGGFTSTQPNGDLDYGVTLGLRIPLGAGSFRGAAEAEMRRRSDRAAFRLIQEAVWLRDQGLLTEEAHPRHFAALYGESGSEKFVF